MLDNFITDGEETLGKRYVIRQEHGKDTMDGAG